MAADVAVVVGNYEGEDVLSACLESLRLQTQEPAETIVVDAASTDRSREIAERYSARFVPAPNNGLGYLYNRGAEAARSPFVLFLNNDVALESSCIDQLAGALEADPNRFAADARQLDWDGETTIHARTVLSHGRLLREFIPGLHLDPCVPADEIVPTVCANGAAMLVRREQHLQLGGFDETFFMEWEDLDLCWRAWLRGWPTVYVPSAVVRHRVGAVTNAAVKPRRSASSHHNLLRFTLKCLPPTEAARAVFGELLRLPRHPRAIATATADVVRELPEIARARAATRPTRTLLHELYRQNSTVR